MRPNVRWILTGLMTLSLTGCACAMHKDKEKDEEKGEGTEVKVSIDQVPDAVKTTLQSEAEGAAIATVDKETDDNKTVYEADAMIRGKNYEIKVAEDGTLLKKKLDDEKDEKDEKDSGGKDKD